ncbi:MAG: sulfotransferase [Rhodobacterales bacterium]|nr:sulfotransferase [Rhodobacterales bacterium]
MIIMLGSPRSGTSWIAKIVDSHPDVLYRHEPDSLVRCPGLPFMPTKAQGEEFADLAGRYLDGLAKVRMPKSACSIPTFPKSFRGGMANSIHDALVYGVKSSQVMLRNRLRLGVPDLVTRGGPGRPRIAIKSVDSLGRAYAFSLAKPQAKIIHIIRHPGGYVASRKRGLELKKLGAATFIEEMAEMEETKAMGWTEYDLQKMAFEEQLALHWAVLNERAYGQTAGQPNYLPLVYEDMCLNSQDLSRKLFADLGLAWSDETETFLNACLRKESGGERYYQVVRNPLDSAFKWKSELDGPTIDRVIAVASRSSIYQKCAAIWDQES